MAYIGTQPKDIRSFGKAKFDFTATQGQTAFTGADDDGKTLGFTAGQVSVYVNGILMDDSDYTASNGNTITLTSAANASDIISVVALQTDIPNSDYVPATGGTFSGAVTHTGAFTSRGIDDNATSTAMTLDASGNVGIGGTAVPSLSSYNSATLHLRQVGSSSVGSQLRFTNGNSGHTNTDGGFISYWADNNFYFNNQETGDFRFFSGGTERMRIDSSGRVVIGLSAAFDTNSKLQASGAGISLKNNYAGSNNNWSNIRNTATGSQSNIYFESGAGNMTLDHSGNLTLSGGVYLGGTGAANLLDDYEEGTWTPTAPTGWTITSQYTYYVKVGNLVTVKAKIFIDGESTGSFSVSGLPFTGLTGLAQMAGPVMYEQISFGGAGDVLSFVESGVSRLDFWYMSNSGGAWTQWTSAETTTNTEIYVNATYVTNT